MLTYKEAPGAIQTTNATPNTANDCFFIKAGSTRAVWLKAINLFGKMGGATSLSSIALRVEKWTTTASSAGTAITPTPDDVGYQAAKHTAAYSASALTSGTGGPLLSVAIGCGVSGAQPWASSSPSSDDAPMLEGAATMSLDLFSVSPTASQNFEVFTSTAE